MYQVIVVNKKLQNSFIRAQENFHNLSHLFSADSCLNLGGYFQRVVWITDCNIATTVFGVRDMWPTWYGAVAKSKATVKN